MSRSYALPKYKTYYNVINNLLGYSMRGNKTGFTFVELIVVLVIIAILATIGFVSYESYISTGRDTARVVQMKGLHQSLSTYATVSKLPNPENKIEIQASGNTIMSQGNITNDIAKIISFQGNIYDKQLEIYPIYVLANNRKDFQLMSFIEDPATLQLSFFSSFAAIDYEILYPKVIGRPLGIFLEEDSKAPIHSLEKYTGSYDIISGTGVLTIYISDNHYFNSNQESISQIIPNQNCKRILEMGKSVGDGIYTISPTGSGNIQVYCDMRTDGGGWTYTAYIDTYSTAQNLFSSDIGSYQTSRLDSDISNKNTSYSINGSQLNHTEMMITIDDKDPIKAQAMNKLIFFKYNLNSPATNLGPLPCSINKNLTYKLSVSGDYIGSSSYSCTSGNWKINTNSGLNMVYIFSGRGIYWYAGMLGNNTGFHAAWVYVR